MLGELWNIYLYKPVFNFLIWIYNNWTDQNMGWAIVYLTIALRMLLLPLTLISEAGKAKNEELEKEVGQLEKEFHYDAVLKKEEVRRLLRTRKVKPWARTLSMGIQGLVLVLLYQVFMQGITGERMIRTLYQSVDFPGRINTNFFGFDLGAPHSLFWAGLVGVWLAAEIYVDFRKSKGELNRGDMFYFILFPLAIAFFLWILPMVKSLFVFTSIVFSFLMHLIISPFFSGGKKEEKKSA